MKKTLFVTALCAVMLFAVSSVAYSAEGLYLSGNVGSALLNDSKVIGSAVPGGTVEIESVSGLALGLAVGYDFGNNFRVEGELARQNNDFDVLSGDTSSYALLFNGYYDLRFGNYTTFISAGIGVARIEANDWKLSYAPLASSSDDDTVFAYQIGAGVGYDVSEKVTLYVKYRYFQASDMEFGTTKMEYSSNNAYVGIRVGF